MTDQPKKLKRGQQHTRRALFHPRGEGFSGRPVEPRVGKACAICGQRPALRMVGTRGFCADHTRDAFVAARRQGPPPERE